MWGSHFFCPPCVYYPIVVNLEINAVTFRSLQCIGTVLIESLQLKNRLLHYLGVTSKRLALVFFCYYRSRLKVTLFGVALESGDFEVAPLGRRVLIPLGFIPVFRTFFLNIMYEITFEFFIALN